MSTFDRCMLVLIALLCSVLIWSVVDGRRSAAPLRATFGQPTLVELPDGSKWTVRHSFGVMCEVHQVKEPK